MPLVFDENRPQCPTYYIRELTSMTLAFIPNATNKQKDLIKAAEKALVSSIVYQGKQIIQAENDKHKQNLIEIKEQFSRQTRETTAELIKEDNARKKLCQELKLEIELFELELSQERNLTTPVDESFHQFDFDPEKPMQSSAYLKVMRHIFKSTAPKQFDDNQGHWRRLEAAIIQATSHGVKACGKRFNECADAYRAENEALNEEIRKLNKYAGEYMRWQNQAEFYMADNINLKLQLNKAEEKIDLLEKKMEDANEKAMKSSDKEKDLELKKMQQTIDRQKLMMEYKEKEQKAAVLYAELQITELQKELLRIRLRDEEK